MDLQGRYLGTGSMKPTLKTENAKVYQGDCLDVLKRLEAGSVHCVVTSPPYFGLRDYGTAEWEGGDENCEHLVRENHNAESSSLEGGKATVHHAKEGFKTKCPRCGARRIDKQLGLEEQHDCLALLRGREPCGKCYVCKVVLICRELRRVLRDDGIMWLNLGSCYAGGDTTNNIFDHSSSKRRTFDKVDDGVPFMLRNDLTLEELAYVLSELSSFANNNKVG